MSFFSTVTRAIRGVGLLRSKMEAFSMIERALQRVVIGVGYKE